MMSFESDLKKFAKKANTNVQTVLRASTLQLFSAVVKRSPIDTGRFRANWQISIGSPDLTTTTAVDPTGGNTISAIRTELANYKGLRKIWLTNNLPYAQRLEFDGWSAQAPNGMVRISVIEFNRYLSEAAARVE